MDIKCALNCTRQKEGKCALTEIPSELTLKGEHRAKSINCAYFSERR